MSLFGWLKPKKHYVFTNSDRDASAEIREAEKQAKLSKIRKQQRLDDLAAEVEIERMNAELQKLRDDSEPMMDDFEQEEDFKTVLLKIFGPAIAQKMMATAQSPIPTSDVLSHPPDTPTSDDGIGHYSDGELQKIWQATPEKYKDIAKKLPDKVVKEYIARQLPNANDDDLNRALALVRTGA